MVLEKSCGAVVYRKDTPPRRYLLLKYLGGHWGFPKGHVEEGETEKQTVSRELREETGITDVFFGEGFREEIQYSFQRGDETVNKKAVFYVLETEGEAVTLSHEHIDYRWLGYGGARNTLTYGNTRHILDKAEAYLD